VAVVADSTAPERTPPDDTTEMLPSEILAFIRRAIGDPGSIVPRGHGESVPNWSARAVLLAIDEHPVLDLRSCGSRREPDDTTEGEEQ
jgi:hypothetical protein